MAVIQPSKRPQLLFSEGELYQGAPPRAEPRCGGGLTAQQLGSGELDAGKIRASRSVGVLERRGIGARQVPVPAALEPAACGFAARRGRAPRIRRVEAELADQRALIDEGIARCAASPADGGPASGLADGTRVIGFDSRPWGLLNIFWFQRSASARIPLVWRAHGLIDAATTHGVATARARLDAHYRGIQDVVARNRPTSSPDAVSSPQTRKN